MKCSCAFFILFSITLNLSSLLWLFCFVYFIETYTRLLLWALTKRKNQDSFFGLQKYEFVWKLTQLNFLLAIITVPGNAMGRSWRPGIKLGRKGLILIWAQFHFAVVAVCSVVSLFKGTYLSFVFKNLQGYVLFYVYLLKRFICIQVNLDEVEYPLRHYRSMQEFFIRRLKPVMSIIDFDFEFEWSRAHAQFIKQAVWFRL